MALDSSFYPAEKSIISARSNFGEAQDLTDVNYIDSSGIGAMVTVYLAASRGQCDLKVVNAQPRIRDLFEITKLSAVFENHGGYRGLTSDQ